MHMHPKMDQNKNKFVSVKAKHSSPGWGGGALRPPPPKMTIDLGQFRGRYRILVRGGPSGVLTPRGTLRPNFVQNFLKTAWKLKKSRGRGEGPGPKGPLDPLMGLQT